MKWVSLALLLFVGLMGCGQIQSGTSSETQNTVSVRIVDSLGIPLGRVRVEARLASAMAKAGEVIDPQIVAFTDDSGIARFSVHQDSIHVFVARTKDGNCQVRGSRGTIVGQLEVPGHIEGFSPVRSRQWVSLQGLGVGVWTDSTGYFAFEGVPAGMIQVRVQDDSSRIVAGSLSALEVGDSVQLDTLAREVGGVVHEFLIARLNTTANGANLTVSVPNLPLLLRVPTSMWPRNGEFLTVRDARSGRILPSRMESDDLNGTSVRVWTRIDTLFGNDSTQKLLLVRSPVQESFASVFDTTIGWRGAWEVTAQKLWRDQTGTGRTASGGCSGNVKLGPSGVASHCSESDTIRFANSGLDLAKTFQISFWIKPDVRETKLVEMGSKALSIGMTSKGKWIGWTPLYQTGTSSASQVLEGMAAIDSVGWSHLTLRATPLGPDSLIGSWFLNGKPMIMPKFRYLREPEGAGLTLQLAGYRGWIQGLRYQQKAYDGNWMWAQWQAQQPNSTLVTWEKLP